MFRVPKWGGKEDVPFISIADDYGDIVHGIFLEPETWNGKLVQGVSDIESFDDVVASFEHGKKVALVNFEHTTDYASYRKESSLRSSTKVARP